MLIRKRLRVPSASTLLQRQQNQARDIEAAIQKAQKEAEIQWAREKAQEDADFPYQVEEYVKTMEQNIGKALDSVSYEEKEIAMQKCDLLPENEKIVSQEKNNPPK